MVFSVGSGTGVGAKKSWQIIEGRILVIYHSLFFAEELQYNNTVFDKYKLEQIRQD